MDIPMDLLDKRFYLNREWKSVYREKKGYYR